MADDLPITERLVLPGSDLSEETLRAGGPGGQHQNTTDSAVRLRLALDATQVLTEGVKDRLRQAFPSQVTSGGELLVVAREHRSQAANREAARDRLVQMIRAHLRAPPPRRPTRPTKASKTRRLTGKRLRGAVKSGRGKVQDDGT
ncbi:MAG: aminoacyl-tRNA hydrolase [Alphaproteobacteria bacterium]|nr:aminoacyl-tRNA hydrolase [Alphaproteobacteria bacterium]